MHSMEFADISENNLSGNSTDQETIESLKILAKILLSVNHSEPTDTPVINLNQTPEKIAA